MAIYTFENIVINGVDTSKTYNDSTLPISGVKRIICNGEDKLHKTVNTTINSSSVAEGWGADFLSKYKTKVLDKVTIGDGVKSIEYIDDGTNITGVIIEFDVPTIFSYNIEENDTVAGGLVHYESDSVRDVTMVKLEFINNGYTLEITATNYYKTIEPYVYDLNIENIQFIIKGRVY